MNKLKRFNNIFSWVFLITMIVFLILSVVSLINVNGTDEPTFIMGHRLIYLTSGSMEPTIKTNALSLTRKVDRIEDINTGDIISFNFVDDRDGKTYRTTHRVVGIDKDKNQLITKGDNNAVTDAYPISIGQVESKVILIMNWTADIVNTWNSGRSGKLLLISVLVLIIVLYYVLKMLIKAIIKYITTRNTITTKE